jgi:hypothetical protein
MVNPVLASDSCSCRIVCLNLGCFLKMRHGHSWVTFLVRQRASLTE